MPRFIARRKKYSKKGRTSRRRTSRRVGGRRKKRYTKRRRVGRMRRGYVRGRGSYRLSSSGGGGGTQQSIPTFANSGEGALSLRHKELIGSIVIKKDYNGNFAIATLRTSDQKGVSVESPCQFRVVAGNKLLFPWGSSIMTKFESYKLNGMMLKFESLVNPGSTTFTYCPEIIMCSMDNIYVGKPTNAQQMKIQGMSNSGKMNYDLHCGVECHPSRISNPERYVVSLGQDQKAETGNSATWQTSLQNREETDHAQFFIAIDGGDSAQFAAKDQVVGKLWITYDVQLKRPVFEEHVNATQTTLSKNSEKQSQSPAIQAGHYKALSTQQKMEAAERLANDGGDFNTSMYQEDKYDPSNSFSTGLAGMVTVINGNEYVIPVDSNFHPANAASEDSVINFQEIGLKNLNTNTVPFPFETWKKSNLTDLGKHPRLYFRLGYKQFVPTATNVPANKKLFRDGSFCPKTDFRDSNFAYAANYGLVQHYLDNIGIRWARVGTATTRFFFCRKIKPGTLLKCVIRWSGVIRKSTGTNQHSPILSTNNTDVLWMNCERPTCPYIAFNGFSRLGPMDPEDCLFEINEVDEASSNALGTSIGNAVRGRSEFRNNVSNNFQTSGIPQTTLHPDYPFVCVQDHYERTFVIRAEESDYIQGFDIGPLTCLHGLKTAPVAWTTEPGGGAVDFATNLTLAPVIHSVLDQGSRSIEISEMSQWEGTTYETSKQLALHKFGPEQANSFILDQTNSNIIFGNTFAGNMIQQLL